MATSRDYYQILTVRRNATTQQIKAAFRKKAMRYHPDHNPGKEAWANKKLQGIIEAFEVLSDPARRRLYNRRLAQPDETSIRTPARRRANSTRQYMVNIMRHQAVPGWARTAAFAYVFFDYFSKESRRAE
jgi:curved DNA-binding protein CbpA